MTLKMAAGLKWEIRWLLYSPDLKPYIYRRMLIRSNSRVASLETAAKLTDSAVDCR